MPIEELRRLLLAAALPHVLFDGWSRRCLRAAAGDAGLSEAEARIAFPRGTADLVDFHAREGDRRMEAKLETRDLAALRIRERIASAVRLRLETSGGGKEVARRALALAATPGHAAWGARVLYRTVDAIWYAIGDDSTDMNFYTKRAVLAGVYAATLVFWLNDESEGSAATWAFLDRRIEDVMRIQKARGRIERAFERLPSPFRLLDGLAPRRRPG